MNGSLEIKASSGANGEIVHEEDEADDPETPIDPDHPTNVIDEVQQNGIPAAESTTSPETTSNPEDPSAGSDSVSQYGVEAPLVNGMNGTRSRKATLTSQTLPERLASHTDQDTEFRLEALAQERAALRDEVTQLRQSLEEIQIKHQEELRSANDQLEEVQGEKEHVEAQYQSLRGKVGQIQSNLKERLKADAVCLHFRATCSCSHLTGRTRPSKRPD